jgi:hypothetical protein
MPFIVADRVKETTTTTGTGSYTLAGAVANFRAFSSVCANSDTVNYAAVDNAGAGWEVGLGTWSTGGTLARTTIYASSNGGSAVNWSAGTREIFLTAAATFLASRAASGANSDITSLTGLTTALSVGQGGTGATTLTANNVLLGNGTSAVQFVAPGTSGNVLTSNGTTWTSQPGGGGGSLLGATDSVSPFETSLGFEAGNSTTGVNNTFVGYQAGKANSTGTNNTAAGHQAATALTTGSNNVAIGSGALDAATTGGTNVAIGLNAMGAGIATAATGNNVAIGNAAGNAITSGTNNIAIGANAVDALTTGGNNIGVGPNALGAVTTGGSNVAIGNGAGSATNASENVFLGSEAATNNTSNANVAVGFRALFTSGSAFANVAVGSQAGFRVTTGRDNTFLGFLAGQNSTTGITTGQNNIIIGSTAEATSATTSNEITLGNASITRFRVPGLGINWTSANVPGPSGTVLISSTDLSNVATAEFSLPSGYDYYTFALGRVLPVTDNVEFQFLASTNGGTSYLSSYRNQLTFFRNTTTSTQSFSASVGYVVTNNVGNATNEQGVSGTMNIMFPALVKRCIIHSRMGSEDQNGDYVQSMLDTTVTSDSSINYIRFNFSSGNLSSGTITLYGHRA